MPTEPHHPDSDPVESLFQRAERSAQRDAAQVGMGLQERVMRRIREGSKASSWSAGEAWTNAFLRGAMVSAAVVLLLAGWAMVDAVYPTLVNEYALSTLEDHSTPWSLTDW